MLISQCCASIGETPTLAILENEFTYNVAGGAANTTTFGAAYYTTTCRCANDTTGGQGQDTGDGRGGTLPSVTRD
jgi:hypothetical protein